MTPFRLLFALAWGTAALGADPAFLTRASALLSDGKVDEAGTLARSFLDGSPDDPDALVVAGTVVLYQAASPRRDDSIFRPGVEPTEAPVPRLMPSGAEAVAAFWKRVPALDPSRSYLWGDLAQLTYRAGDSAHAVEFALRALAEPDPVALRAAASVLFLNLDVRRAAEALAKIPGNRTALLYQGLDAWRAGTDAWRVPLKAFVDDPGSEPTGNKLASYLIGPTMRDTESGFVEALKVDGGMTALVVRQKYVDRYPNKFLARLDLARSLSQFGSFAQALAQYDEIDRRQLASTPEERQAVLFQQAWAQQASGHLQEASRLWEMVSDSRDFYLRSAAAWFIGSNATAQGKLDEAKAWWSKVAEEPARSKYAFWADEELKRLH